MVSRVMPREGRGLWDGPTFATGSVLVLSIVLGGGTRPGFLSDALLQLAAVPLLIGSLFAIGNSRPGAGGRVALAITALVIGIALLQLVPLPANWGWSSIVRLPRPGVDGGVAEVATLLPASTSPRATVLAILAGVPAVAVFLATCQLSCRRRRHLSLVVLGTGMVSVLIAMLQVAQGPTSTLRFFAITNSTEAVGFFANRNHFSAFLYVLLLVVTVWSVHAAQRLSAAPVGRRYDAEVLLPLLASLTVIAILVAMQVFARSRAGLGLTMLALLGVGLLSLMSRRTGEAVSTRLVVVAGVFGVLLAVQFALYGMLERFEGDPLADARIRFARNTIEAARASLPLGSGLGSFVEVYGLFERPQDALIDTFANRAHNDFLEVWLETGVLGVAAFLVFCGWFGFAFVTAWRRPREQRAPIDVNLPRAASLIVLLLLLHSIVDYPLRTAAMLVMFAMACAFLVPAPAATDDGDAWSRNIDAGGLPSIAVRSRPTAAGGSVREAMPVPATLQGKQEQGAAQRGAWGAGIEWPAAWRKFEASAPSEAETRHETSDEPSWPPGDQSDKERDGRD